MSLQTVRKVQVRTYTVPKRIKTSLERKFKAKNFSNKSYVQSTADSLFLGLQQLLPAKLLQSGPLEQ
jgi:hypothetical protein